MQHSRSGAFWLRGWGCQRMTLRLENNAFRMSRHIEQGRLGCCSTWPQHALGLWEVACAGPRPGRWVGHAHVVLCAQQRPGHWVCLASPAL
jgi:hypothetical protein